GAYPSLAIGPLLDSHMHDVAAMLRESLETEGQALKLYHELLSLVEGQSVALEEFARQMIHTEEQHAAEVDKMLRKPG
ncbi:ferritin-like domain-containing protein, partial [Acinetobacter baumannii]